MTEEQKNRIDHYIQIYLNGIQSVSNDAGFESYSIMARMIDFKGDMPPPSGNDQADISMIRAMRLLRGVHEKMPVISSAVSALKHTERPKIIALLAKNYFVGLCEWTGKAYTDTQRAEEIGQSLDAFRHNVKASYRLMQNEMEVAERYREFFGL